MIKTKYLLLILLLSNKNVISQNPNLDIKIENGSITILKENGLNFKDKKINKYQDIEGDPYYINEYKNALIYLDSNKKKPIFVAKAKIDLFANEFIYEDENNNLLTPTSNIFEINFIDNLINKKLLFKFEYVSINNKINVVRTYNNGKIKLQEQIKISLKDGTYNPMEGNLPKQRFIKTNYFYININSQLNYISKLNFKNINNILHLNNEIINWLNVKNNKLNTIDKIIEFLIYYNSVQ